MTLDDSVLRQAQKYARTKFNELREEGGRWSGHAGHAATEALRLAEIRFSLPTCGVEGVCSSSGERGFSYLNTGETYALTLGAYTDYSTVHFVRTSLANVVESNTEWG